MRKIWLVIKHELGVTLRRRSFWLVTLLLPAVQGKGGTSR